MQKKTIAMMLVAGCSIGMLTGCGISQEEHDNIILKIQTENAEAVAQLEKKVTDLEVNLKSEQRKAATARVELDDAAERIKTMQQEQTAAAEELAAEKAALANTTRNLASAKSRAEAADEAAAEAAAQLADAEAELVELERRFVQYLKNSAALDEVAPAVQSAPEAVAGEARSALDILNEMSTK